MIDQSLMINNVSVCLRTEDQYTDEMNRLSGIVKAAQKVKVHSDRDIDLLDVDFKAKIKIVLARCEAEGFVFKPFFTVRSVWKQSILWRQSRPTAEIQKAVSKLKQEGAVFLAAVLKSVGPQNGRWATNALPGQSWHQWKLAIDCFLATPQGRAVWSSNHPAYKTYADHAKALGLTAGYYWQRQDSVHLQRDDKTVRSCYTWEEIDKQMTEFFPEADV